MIDCESAAFQNCNLAEKLALRVKLLHSGIAGIQHKEIAAGKGS